MKADAASDEAALARIRELREGGMSWKNIRHELAIGNGRFDRLRGLLDPGLARDRRFSDAAPPAPPKPTASQPIQRNKAHATMKTITLTLTDAAAARLEAIAESVYLPSDVFATALVAGYLAAEPLSITLAPSDPDGAEVDEEEEEENAEPKEPEKPDEPEEFVFDETDFAWLKPGVEFVVRNGDGESAVKCVAIKFYDADGNQVVSKDGTIHTAGDQIFCVATDGSFAGNKMFFPEEVVFQEANEDSTEDNQ